MSAELGLNRDVVFPCVAIRSRGTRPGRECGCFGRLKRLRRTLATAGQSLLSLQTGILAPGAVSDLRGWLGPFACFPA